MDFHSLSRKELQTLCKKNKIPANITNLAMADALAALPQVEGLDEFLNPTEADGVARTPDIRHHPRTATRRKGIKEEPEITKVCSRVQRGSRAKKVELEQDSNVKILPVTPAVMPPSGRRPALPVSTRRKKEETEEDDDRDDKNGVLLLTPAAFPSSRSKATIRTPRGGATSVQPSYSTRRSVRLLEKNLSKMTLLDAEELGAANTDHAISQDSTETQKVNDAGASLQTVSTVVSEETDELEVSSLEKNTEYEECRSHDLGSEIQLVSREGSRPDPQEEGLGKVNCLEAEPHEPNLNLEGISESCDDSNEVGECYDDLVVDLKKSVAIEEAAQKEEEDNEAGSELLPELDGFSEPGNKDCCGTKQDFLSAKASEDAFMEVTEQDVAALSVEVPDDASLEVADQCVAALVPMSSASGDSVKLMELVDTDNQGSNEDDDNQDKNNETGVEVAGQRVALSVEVPGDASLEVGDQCVAGLVPISSTSGDYNETGVEVADRCVALSVEVPDDASLEVGDQYVAGLVPISSISGDSVKLEELVEGNTDNHGSNEYGDNQDKNNETADGNYIQNFEPMFDADEKAADEKDLASPEEVLGLVSSNFCFYGEHREEELKDKSEHSEDSMAEIEKMDNASDATGASFTGFAVEKDAGFENSIGVHEAEDLNHNSEQLEALTEDSEEHAFDVPGASSAILAVEIDATFENSNTVLDAENVTLESSLLDAGVYEAEDLRDNSEKLESKAQAEELEEHAAGKETALDAFPSVLGGVSNPQIPQQISLESTCNANTLVDGDDISEEIAIPKLEPSVLAETLAFAPVHDEKISYIPIQSLVAESLFPAQSETKGFANEIHMHNANMMKENLTTNELDKKSIGELKKMLKMLTLDGKSNCKSKTDNVVKEVEKKRTALQALPENRMTNMEAQNDG